MATYSLDISGELWRSDSGNGYYSFNRQWLFVPDWLKAEQ
jgi:hypothetical protein